MKKAGVETLKGDEWEIEGDLVLKKEKVYILKDENLRLEVIWSHYDVPVARHRERQKTTELVMRNYQWPGVTRDVGRYVKGYDLCQRIKNRIEALVGKLMVNEVSKKAQTYLMVDFITKLPLVVEKDFGSMQSVVKDSTFCSNNRRDISRRISETVYITNKILTGCDTGAEQCFRGSV